MKVFPPQTLTAPGVQSTVETWIFTDGDMVSLTPLPGTVAAVLVRHPPPEAAPPGIMWQAELKSFGRHFFGIPFGP